MTHHLRRSTLGLCIATFVACIANPVVTPLARGAVGPELAVDAKAPIRHQQFYQGERELFGYNPSFAPNTVTFDDRNVPYIQKNTLASGKHVITRSDQTRGGVIQTLDDAGNWLELSFIDDIRAAYPSWNGTYTAGTHFEDRVVFDDAGDAYMLVNNTRGSSIGRNLLLYSKDKARTWQVYALPGGGFHQWAYFEVPDGQSRMTGPPTIRTFFGGFDSGAPITLVKPAKTTGGGLSIISNLAINSSQVRSGVTQAGLGNATATVGGGRSYLAYLSTAAAPGGSGTAQYIVSHNYATGQTSSPVLLGTNGSGSPDIHDAPAIAVDSDGYIHAVLGNHHGRFKYTRSVAADSIDSGFTSPINIGKNPSSGGYTYVSMVIDQDDTIHVVGRYSGDNNRWALDYLRKKDGENWEDLGHLVQTSHVNYSTWDQRLTIDEEGRLFLRYSFYGDQLTDAEAAAYRAKWPDETISRITDSSYWNGINHHDPVILMSDTGGNSWRIATTEDFIAGIPEPGGLAVIGALALFAQRPRRRRVCE